MECIGLIGSLVLGSPGWGWAVLLIMAPFLALLLVGAVRASLSPGWKAALVTLKLSAAGLLAFCLLDPLWTRTHVKPGENIVVLLADNSASLEIRQNSGGRQTRGQWYQSLLTDQEASWQTRLAQNFDVRRYAFGASLTRQEDFQTLSFDSPSTFLASALTTLRSRFQKQPLAAILLFTDGIAQDRELLEQLPPDVRVFPIVADQQRPATDVALGQVTISQTNFEDAPVSLQAPIRVTGDVEGPLQVTLESWPITEGGERQTIRLVPDESANLTARLQVKPQGRGAVFYRLRVIPEKESQAFDQPSSSSEATLANNERLLAVNRDSHTYRVLYIGGRPNWEHKFLARALQEDERLHLVSIVRIARKEGRFDFRGRAGESTNPLYRGFKNAADEETESYDQPVLVRLNTRDATELSQGFPKTAEELYPYEAVVLDDVEAAFFSHEQQALIDRFVSERGAGLLMLGGRDTFRHGQWQRTPVADALPVYLDRPGDAPQGTLNWQLTREGWLETWTRLRDNEQQEQIRLQQLPSYEVLNSVADIKPGARVLAEVSDEYGHRHPALVAQQYGRGRAAAMLIGDQWKWTLRQTDRGADDPAKSWRQLIRWLVSDVPKRLEAAVSPSRSGSTQGTLLQIRVRDRQFQPQDGIRVDVSIRQPDGATVTLNAQPSLSEAGLFEVLHIPHLPGSYVASIDVPATEGEVPLHTEIGWTSNPQAEEFERTAVDLDLLNRLAARTGGEVIPRSRLDEFAAALPYREMPIMETETTPLWHRSWLLGLVLVLLGAEWGLRRMRGLA